MFGSLSSVVFLIPVIIYLLIIGFVIWLIMRLIRSNEQIAVNTDRIARMLKERNQIERDKQSS